MKKNYIVFLISFLALLIQPLFQALFSQQLVSATSATYRVFFRDKGNEEFRPGSALYAKTQAIHSPESLKRRAKSLPADRVLTIQDAPLFEPYLDSLRRTGANILLRLRWQNYTLVTCSSLQIEQIRRFSFVRAVQPATARLFPQKRTVGETAQKKVSQTSSQAAVTGSAALQMIKQYSSQAYALQETNCGTLLYSDSRRQNQSIAIPQVHELGVTGKGVRIGVIDAGFRWREQHSLKGALVLAEYDFIQNDSNTANERKSLLSDLTDQDDHGTKVLSVIAGYHPQNLVGAAFGATFLLAKTEDLRYERHIEEDNVVAALEWLESRGADIVNASLGYLDFDQPDEPYSYKELDGKTAIISRAINDAATRGILCVVSAGNSGRKGFRTINAPGDADGSFTVAALRADSTVVTSFSSRGPRGDGKLKPDIAAQGDSVVVAAPTGREYQYAAGTSFAAPLIAGGAALILSAFPELSASAVRQLLTATASQASNPDSIVGSGIANVYAALRQAGTIVAPDILSYPLWDMQRVGVSALPRAMSLQATLFVRFRGEQMFSPIELRPFPPRTLYLADIPWVRFGGNTAECYATVNDGQKTRRIPEYGTITLTPRASSIPCGIPAAALPIEKPNTVQEGIVPSPVSNDAGFATLLLSTPETSTVEYTVYTSYGSPIAADTVQVSAGISTIPFPVKQFGRGVYFVQVRYNGNIQMFRFIVN